MAVNILQGDALTVLKTIGDESVNCCVTSPPYWGLRDYGTAEWEGGDVGCDHIEIYNSMQSSSSTLGGRLPEKTLDDKRRDLNTIYKEICGKCGAKRIDKQLGLERTPEEYVAKMVEVFREVRRVLRNDGTLWLNLGDSYAHTGPCGGGSPDGPRKPRETDAAKQRQMSYSVPPGLKPKDLCGIPWLVAFALRADGWYLRQDIIWCLSGGTWVYARTQKGDMPMMIRDMVRLDPSTVQLWNGSQWTKTIGWIKKERQGNEIEFVLRSGERISCTPSHRFPTDKGVLEAKDITIGDCLERTIIPEPKEPKDNAFFNEDLAWFVGLYIAEGSKSNDCIQIAGHAKEEDRWYRLNRIAKFYGGYITRTVDKNKMDIRLYGKILNSILDEFVSGRTAKDKCLSTSCWKYSNRFLKSILTGYLSGDGHWEEDNQRWRIGFTRNYNLERDIRTLSARIGFNLTLKLSNSFIGEKKYPSFRGEIRFEATVNGHWNQKSKSEVVEIRKARCREVYDISVQNEPYLFSLASGILTHNSKPNPMPESVQDRCTKAHEYIFLLSKSQRYLYDAAAIAEPAHNWGIRDRSNMRGGTTDPKLKHHGLENCNSEENGRNKRSVWTVSTAPFPGAHFATFPPKLIEPCILAGCPTGGTVLDPFAGSGTTGMVAECNKRNSILIELNPDYIEMAKQRTKNIDEKYYTITKKKIAKIKNEKSIELFFE